MAISGFSGMEITPFADEGRGKKERIHFPGSVGKDYVKYSMERRSLFCFFRNVSVLIML